MSFNNSKFELIRYGKNKSINQQTYHTQSGSTISEKSEVKDLGITMTNDCNFSSHINTITETIRQLTVWVLHTFSTRDAKPMLTLWKSLAIPRLDYCSQLWSPTKKGEIQQHETLQYCFLKQVKPASKSNYKQKLKEFHLYSLERRRERCCIIYTWKILESLVLNLADLITTKLSDRISCTCVMPSKTTKASTAIQTTKFNSF